MERVGREEQRVDHRPRRAARVGQARRAGAVSPGTPRRPASRSWRRTRSTTPCASSRSIRTSRRRTARSTSWSSSRCRAWRASSLPRASDSRRARHRSTACGAIVAVVVATARLGSAASVSADPTPIRHVVILFQENHSFDDVFGRFCVDQAAGTIARDGLNMPCDGAVTGTTVDGRDDPAGARARPGAQRRALRRRAAHIGRRRRDGRVLRDRRLQEGPGLRLLPDVRPVEHPQPVGARRAIRDVRPDLLPGRLAVVGRPPRHCGGDDRRVQRRQPEEGGRRPVPLGVGMRQPARRDVVERLDVRARAVLRARPERETAPTATPPSRTCRRSSTGSMPPAGPGGSMRVAPRAPTRSRTDGPSARRSTNASAARSGGTSSRPPGC